jgi:hypothetical protein
VPYSISVFKKGASTIMKMKTLFILALILVMAGSLSVGPAAASGAKVPFKATIQTAPAIVGVVDNCHGKGIPGLMLQIPGEGYVTHLGETTWYTGDMWACFDGTQGGSMSFTAANGDQLFGGFEGTWTDIPPAPTTFQGTFWITGGTGRFEGSTAAGAYSGRSGGGEEILFFDGMLTK